ncbi:homeobox protein 5-like [Saccostrea cucullata]|uniref:homeobox protein 5-like n=1 Tax=Saccostrea cuccullata TaxID=36930 RepID=UPI002ED3A3A5
MGRVITTVACVIFQISYAIGQLQPFCEDPADRGHCNKLELRYRFNEDSEYCETFLYGGCGGNKNNFKTVGECAKACVDEPKGSICEFPPDAGSCFHATLLRYYYDEETESCKIFYYSGCQGNENNFLTGEACKTKCEALTIEPLPAGSNQGSGYQWNDPGSGSNSGNNWNSPAPTKSVNWNNPRPTNVVNRGWGSHYNNNNNNNNNHNNNGPPNNHHNYNGPPNNGPPRQGPPPQYDFNSGNSHTSNPHNNNNHHQNNHNNNQHRYNTPNHNYNRNNNQHSSHSTPNGGGGSSLTFVENDPNNQRPNNLPPGIKPPEMSEYNGNSPWDSGGWNKNGWNSNPNHNVNNGNSNNGGSSWRSNESRGPPNQGNNNNNGWNNPNNNNNQGGSGGDPWNHSMSFKRRVGAQHSNRHSNNADPSAANQPNTQASWQGQSNGSPWGGSQSNSWNSNGGQNNQFGPMSPGAHLRRRFDGFTPHTTTLEDDHVFTTATPPETTPPYNYNYNRPSHGSDKHSHIYNWDSPPNQPPTNSPPNTVPQTYNKNDAPHPLPNSGQPFPPKKSNNFQNQHVKPLPPEPSYNYQKFDQSNSNQKKTPRRKFAPDWLQSEESSSINQQSPNPPTTTPFPQPPPAPSNNLPLPQKTSWDNMFRRKKEMTAAFKQAEPTQVASYDFEVGSSSKSNVDSGLHQTHSQEQTVQTHKNTPLHQKENIGASNANVNQYDFEANTKKGNKQESKIQHHQTANVPQNSNHNINSYDFEANSNVAPEVSRFRKEENSKSNQDFRRENARRMFDMHLRKGDTTIGNSQQLRDNFQPTNAPVNSQMTSFNSIQQHPSREKQLSRSEGIQSEKTNSNFDNALKSKQSNLPGSSNDRWNNPDNSFDSFLKPKTHGSTSSSSNDRNFNSFLNSHKNDIPKPENSQGNGLKRNSAEHNPVDNINPNNNFDGFRRRNTKNIPNGHDSNRNRAEHNPIQNTNPHSKFDDFRRRNTNDLPNFESSKGHEPNTNSAEHNPIQNDKPNNNFDGFRRRNTNEIPISEKLQRHEPKGRSFEQNPIQHTSPHNNFDSFRRGNANEIQKSESSHGHDPKRNSADQYPIHNNNHHNSFDGFRRRNTNNIPKTETFQRHGQSGKSPGQNPIHNIDPHNSFDRFRQANGPSFTNHRDKKTMHNEQHTSEFNSIGDKKQKLTDMRHAENSNSHSHVEQSHTQVPGQTERHVYNYSMFQETSSSKSDQDTSGPRNVFDLSGTHTAQYQPTQPPTRQTVLSGGNHYAEVSPSLGQGQAPTSRPGFGISRPSHESMIDSTNQISNTEPFSLTTSKHQPHYSGHSNNHMQNNGQQSNSWNDQISPLDSNYLPPTDLPVDYTESTQQPVTQYSDPGIQDTLGLNVNGSSNLEKLLGQMMPSKGTTKIPIGFILTHKPFTDSIEMQKRFPLLYEKVIKPLNSRGKVAKNFQTNNEVNVNGNYQQSNMDKNAETHSRNGHNSNHMDNDGIPESKIVYNNAASKPQQGPAQFSRVKPSEHNKQSSNQHIHHLRAHGHQSIQQEHKSWEQQSHSRGIHDQQQQSNQQQHSNQHAQQPSPQSRRQQFMEASRNQHQQFERRQQFNQRENQVYQRTTASPIEPTTQMYTKNTYPPIFNMLVRNSMPPTQTPQPETMHHKQSENLQPFSKHTEVTYSTKTINNLDTPAASFVGQNSLRLGGPSFNPVHENVKFGNQISGPILDSVPELQLYETREPVIPFAMISNNKSKIADGQVQHSQNILMDKDERNSMKMSSIDPYYSKDIMSGTKIERISTLTPAKTEATYSMVPTAPTTTPPLIERVQHASHNRKSVQSNHESAFGRFGDLNQYRQQANNMQSDQNGNTGHHIQDRHKQTILQSQNNNQQDPLSNLPNSHQVDQRENTGKRLLQNGHHQIRKTMHITVSLKSTQSPPSAVLGIQSQRHSFDSHGQQSPASNAAEGQTSAQDITSDQHPIRNFHRMSHNRWNNHRSNSGFAISPMKRVHNSKLNQQSHQVSKSSESNNRHLLSQSQDKVASSAAMNQQNGQFKDQVVQTHSSVRTQHVNRHQSLSSSNQAGRNHVQNTRERHNNRNIDQQKIEAPLKEDPLADTGFYISSPRNRGTSSKGSAKHDNNEINKSISKSEPSVEKTPVPAPTQGYLNFMADFGGMDRILNQGKGALINRGLSSERNEQNHKPEGTSSLTRQTNRLQTMQNTENNNQQISASQNLPSVNSRQQTFSRFQRRQGSFGGFQRRTMNVPAKTTTTTTTTAAPVVRQQQTSQTRNRQCYLPKAEGHCRRYQTAYYFDVTSNECKTFLYSGCYGNANRFNTRTRCEQACLQNQVSSSSTNTNSQKTHSQTSNSQTSNSHIQSAQTSNSQTKASQTSICRMAQDRGTCRKWTTRYYYDPNIQNCRSFWFGGCGGNENNFSTKSECQRRCYGS